MSMHPVEQAIYCSSVLFPWGLCALHPVHFYFAMFNTMLSPAPGHSGFQEPGTATQRHFTRYLLAEKMGENWPRVSSAQVHFRR